MAAYAALVTLINLMEDMQNHPRLSTSFDEKQIESLSEKVHFLLNFIESYDSHGGSKEAEDLESEIASAAQEAEDVIESHIVDRILAGETSSSSLLNIHKKLRVIMKKVQEKLQSKDDKYSLLEKVMKEMDFIKEKIVKMGQKAGVKDDSVLPTSSRPRTNRKTSTMVGFGEELLQLLDMLTGEESARQIISIAGLCGMGKTTLASNAFEHPVIVHHFDIRAWATISQEFSAQEIFLKLLSCEGDLTSETDDELGLRLHQKLSGRRYFIVLDDIWNDHDWGKIKHFLPDNGNGSRIIMTTRIHNLSRHCSASFRLNFLDQDNSWKLFCEKAFGEDDCPSELVEVGKNIVEQCRGLPLSIVVIAGYLSKSSRTKGHWEYIAINLNLVLISGGDDRPLKVLSLSYNHLPARLKPCLLYTGVFREDEEIYVSKLIRLWVAEGFLRANKAQSLEEIAESYLEDLIDRNLILVHKRGHNGGIITCKIHDLMRELCLMVAKKEKFLRLLNLQDTSITLNRERRIVIHGGSLDKKFHLSEAFLASLKSASVVHSLVCNADQLPFDFKLLKVQTLFSAFPDKFEVHRLEKWLPKHVNLRYLHYGLHPDEDSSGHIHGSYSSPRLNLPSSISLLWNLQTLIIAGNFEGITAPPEIWKMSQLRHLVCNRVCLPDPPPRDQRNHIVMQNLQTLSEVVDFRLSEEVCNRIPNIKKLRICYSVPGIFSELKSLTKMESLTCEFIEDTTSCDFAKGLKFPSSLRELCLIKCCLGWEELTVVGSLPCLEVLRLGSSMKGTEWSPIEGEFQCLKYMEIWGNDDLIYWNHADNSHFPVLESLHLRCFSKLAEIPSGIGEIPTLGHIRLEHCSVHAAISAMRILVEQESFGNEGIQLEVGLRSREDHQSFREMMQEEDLNSSNLRLLTAK